VDDQTAAIQERLKGFFPDALGLRITVATPERVVGEVTVSRALCTVPGVMHGGAIMAVADTLGAVATVLNLPADKRTTTLESKTNFFAAGAEGAVVTAETVPLHRGRTTMVWETTVRNPDGRMVAKVTQTQMVL
jgi:1,4-dihydroxy-2-naphthoyl-CoA hydrolase